MRLFAAIHDGVVVALERAVSNPFHHAQHSVDVTAVPVRVGDTVDQHGNVGPSPVLSVTQATERNRSVLRGVAMGRMLRGVWLEAEGQDDKVRIDTHHESLAMLTALAAAGAHVVQAADGCIARIDAASALEEAGHYLASCMERAAELHDKIGEDANASLVDGWPDNGEETEDAKPAPELRATASVGVPGNGVLVREVAPDPDPGTSAAVTRLDGREMPADVQAAAEAQHAAGAEPGVGDSQVQQEAQAHG